MKRGWGGKRIGAGRPARGAIASEPHKRRATVHPALPVHVIARLIKGIAIDRDARRAIDIAIKRSLGRTNFRIVHLSIANARLELVIEAADRHALALGMQGFSVAAARHLNRLHGRTGAVFPDRYRCRPLLTRSAVRALLSARTHTWIRRTWPETVMLVATLLPPPPTPPPL